MINPEFKDAQEIVFITSKETGSITLNLQGKEVINTSSEVKINSQSVVRSKI